MIKLPSSINNAVTYFSKLPGVGEKTALRQIMNMVNWTAEDIQAFAGAMSDLGQIKKCNECGMYSEVSVCDICNNTERAESQTLCIVETISDLMAIEKSENFNGVYHVLGGVLNPLMGIGPNELKIDFLIERVEKLKIKSILLAVNPSVEGDATCSYINQLLKDVLVDRIGFGIPMGGSLEYLDPLTISKALENRKRID